jgi:ABC-type transport system substrate-binding protein
MTAAARALLSEVGYPDGFELEFMATATLTNTDTVAIEHLKAIGVQIKPVTVESSVLTANRAARKYKHAINGGRLGVTAWTPIKIMYDFWAPDSTRNVSGVNDSGVERANRPRSLRWMQTSRFGWFGKSTSAFSTGLLSGNSRRFWSLIRHPWLHDVASSVQGNFCCYGNTQLDIAWVDDTAPGGREGRLKL